MTKRKRLLLIVILVGTVLIAGVSQYLYWFTPMGAFMSYFLKGEQEISGTIQVKALEVPGSDRSIDYVVYLPPGYDSTDERYPTIYHLHGAIPLDRERTIRFIHKDVNWIAHALEAAISKGLAQPSLIVAPYDGVGTSMWSDSKDGAIQAESDVIQVLIPYIDTNYRTMAERRDRAVQGFSMGGFGAAKMALKFPELFSSAVVYDGALHDWDTLTTRRLPRKFKVAEKLFGNDQQYFERSSPWNLHEDYRAYPIAIRVNVGILTDYNQDFPRRLETINVEHAYEDVACGHDLQCLIDKTGQDSLRFMARTF